MTKHDEAAVRIAAKLDELCGGALNTAEIRKAVEEVLNDYEVNDRETALVPINNMQEMIMLYIAAKKTEGLSNATLKQYGQHLIQFARSTGKNAQDIQTNDARLYLARKSQSGIKNSTLATESNILRGFFNWLENEEYIVKSPMRKIKNVKTEKRVRKALTKEDFEILRNGCKTLRQRALLELLYSTGCRLSEIANAKKNDIDWQRLQMHVIGKGNKERIVFISSVAQVHIKRYLKSRKDDCDSLLATERKEYRPMGNRAIQIEIKTIMEQSGIDKNVFPHLLRHTFSTHLLNAGMEITVLQEILGHESLDTTMVYSKLSSNTVEHAYRKCS